MTFDTASFFIMIRVVELVFTRVIKNNPFPELWEGV